MLFLRMKKTLIVNIKPSYLDWVPNFAIMPLDQTQHGAATIAYWSNTNDNVVSV